MSTMKPPSTPARPAMPSGPVLHETLLGPRIFASEQALEKWKQQSFWRRWLGLPVPLKSA